MEQRSPFLIDGPATVSFSGGRTSGFMLRRILDEGLRPDVHVLFANTGKERVETLDFVEECSQRWAIRVRWVEYRPVAPFFEEVDHASASRNGEPFRAMVTKERYMPNASKRLCTKSLKLKTMHRFARKALGLLTWTAIVGLRYDEYGRVMNVRASPVATKAGATEILTPLADAKVTIEHVTAFWKAQPFDLRLGRGEGNCDLCFLKPPELLVQLIRKRPGSEDWWAELEVERGMPFSTRGSYVQLRTRAARPPEPTLFDSIPGWSVDCHCTD